MNQSPSPIEDPDSFDSEDCSIYEAPQESVVDLIEEERCEKSPDDTHTYMKSANCICCGMLAPWIRRDACRAA